MKAATAREAQSLNGVAAKVLAVMPFAAPVTAAEICKELFQRGSRIDHNIVLGCLRALVSSGHAKESLPLHFARTTIASGDEPEARKPLRVVSDTTNNPGGFMALPAHVAKGLTDVPEPQHVTEREPLHDIGALAAKLRKAGRDLLIWAEDLERLGLEFEGRVEAAGQDGKQLAQLRNILKNLGV